MRNLENIPRITVPIREFALLVQRYGYEALGQDGCPRAGRQAYIADTIAESIRNMRDAHTVELPLGAPVPNTKSTVRKLVYVIDRMHAERIFDEYLLRLSVAPEGEVSKKLLLIQFSEQVKQMLLEEIFGDHPRE